jgi:hypothetical protein
MNMKRIRLWVIGTGVLVIVTTTAPSLADDDERGCSNASLRGRYGLATHGDFVGVYGTETPPVIHFYTGPSGDRAPVRVDEVTAETFDGMATLLNWNTCFPVVRM